MRDILKGGLKNKDLILHLEKGSLTTGVVTDWLPLVMIDESKNRVGVNIEGVWIVESRRGLVELMEPKAFVFTLPLLERGIKNLEAEIGEAVGLKEVKEAVLHEFPFREVIEAGFAQGSDYWANLALGWYKHLPNVTKLQLTESLKMVSEAKWASQKLRQAVFHEIRLSHQL